MTVAGLGHPSGAGEMGVIDHARAFRLGRRVDPEDDPDGLAPVGVFSRRIEQAPIGLMVALVIVGDMRRVGRAILESAYRHRLVPSATIASCTRRFTEHTP